MATISIGSAVRTSRPATLESEPQVISSYGEGDRPTLVTGSLRLAGEVLAAIGGENG